MIVFKQCDTTTNDRGDVTDIHQPNHRHHHHHHYGHQHLMVPPPTPLYGHTQGHPQQQRTRYRYTKYYLQSDYVLRNETTMPPPLPTPGTTDATMTMTGARDAPGMFFLSFFCLFRCTNSYLQLRYVLGNDIDDATTSTNTRNDRCHDDDDWC